MSLKDRTVRQVANRYTVANVSQIIAVTAAAPEAATEGRTPFTWSPNTTPSLTYARATSDGVVNR